MADSTTDSTAVASTDTTTTTTTTTLTPHTPPIGTKGIYTLLSPFAANMAANTLYTCRAIRDFADITDMGVDIVATYYTPVGLTQADYEADVKAGARIISLMATDQAAIHLPDTYISAYPSTGNVPYSQIILAISLGELPDSLDLTFVQSQVADAANAVTGVTSTVTPFKIASTGIMTQEQSQAAEAARQAKITEATIPAQQITALKNQITTLQEQNALCMQMLEKAGVITTASTTGTSTSTDTSSGTTTDTSTSTDTSSGTSTSTDTSSG